MCKNIVDRTTNTEKFKPKYISSPYNLKETIGYFYRNYFGVSNKRKNIVKSQPNDFVLDPSIQPSLSLSFIGDIMDMKDHHFEFGPTIKSFVDSSDFLIGNFEATLTTKKGPIMSQYHNPHILTALKNLFPSEQTYLSLANNHAGDFGETIFNESVEKLKRAKFNVFGTQDIPYCDLRDTIRIIGGSMWSNQKCNYINPFKNIANFSQMEKFNIAYPHWSYELELYPRPSIIQKGRSLLSTCDAIIGHHSHIPQPITISYSNNSSKKKLVAYGLGDICIYEKLKHYTYGIVLNIDIGRNQENKWNIGKISWKYTQCKPIGNDIWQTEIIQDFPY